MLEQTYFLESVANGRMMEYLNRKGYSMKSVKNSIHYWCEDVVSRKYLGQGVSAAILDTGITPHPDFGHRIVSFFDVVNGRRNAYDDSDHGTHVAGILAGSGKLSDGIYGGMAPKANLIIVKVLDQDGDGLISQVMKGIRWILENRGRYHIRIVNISVGTKPDVPREGAEVLIKGVESLWDAGLIVVASAGNYGPREGSVAIPGVSRKIITVGAMEGKTILNCSGRGPTEDCVVKPDVLAPGAEIIACQKNGYGTKSGTSMATPVVSGAVALLLSKYQDMSNVEVKLRIRETMDENKKINIEKLMRGW